MSLTAARFCPNSLKRPMFRAFMRSHAFLRPQTALLTTWPSPFAVPAHPLATACAPLSSSMCLFSSVPARLQQHRGTHVSRCLATAWSSTYGNHSQRFGHRSGPHAPQPQSQQQRQPFSQQYRPRQNPAAPTVPSPLQASAMQRQSEGAAPAKGPSADYGIEVKPGAGRMVLVDALPLLYKAHFAFPADSRLHSASGQDTTVVYVFLNMLLNLLSLSPPPTHFAVVFDASGKNFRHELYPDYKGQRPEMPEEIRSAIPLLRTLLGALAVPVFSVPGVEADDVLGTLAVRGVQEGMVVAVASPDKDFFQLLRLGLILLRPPKKAQLHAQQDAAGTVGGAAGGAAGGGDRPRVSKFMLLPYTEDDFRQEWQLEPAQFVDLLALAGDATDNVPGVPGIGPKTAGTLLRQHGSLEALLEHAAEVPKRAGAALQSPEGAAAARLSKQLVRIETALDIPPLQQPLDDLRLAKPEDGGEAVRRMFQELDLKAHDERLRKLWAGPAYRAAPEQQRT